MLTGTQPALRPTAIASSRLTAKRHQPLYFEGDPAHDILVVREGYLTLNRISPTGRDIILDYVGPGDMAGNLHPGTLDTYLETATAAGEAVIDRYPASLIHAVPELPEHVREQAAASLRRRADRIVLSDLPVPARLSAFLLRAGRRFGVHQPNGRVRLTLPLTHEMIASLIDSRRETVSSTFAALRHEQRIQRLQRNTYLLDTYALASTVDALAA